MLGELLVHPRVASSELAIRPTGKLTLVGRKTESRGPIHFSATHLPVLRETCQAKKLV